MKSIECEKELIGKAIMRQFLETFALWLFSQREMTGYELIKLCRNEHLYVATPSRVYPVLKKMERKGFIKVTKEDERGRKFYKITEEGNKELMLRKGWMKEGLKGKFWRDMVV
ncbi:MAG: PadR family transcriptional regulator [Candidatus Anstonellales archaeon]